MKKVFIPIVVVLLECFSVPDSHGADYWARAYMGWAVDDFKQTTDMGYILSGRTGPGDLLVLKLNNDGDILWKKSYSEDIFCDSHIQQTPDGGYIITSCAGNYFIGWTDILGFKRDNNGTIAWQKQYSYGARSLDHPNSIQKTSDGGYKVLGCKDCDSNFNSQASWILS